MEVDSRTIVIKDINDRKEIIGELASLYTDEDFSGNNGEEFTWDAAIENGFESNQDYVINELENHNKLTGIELINEFFDEWLGNDGYYQYYNIHVIEDKGVTVVTAAFTQGD